MKRRYKKVADYQKFEDRKLLAGDIAVSLDSGVLSIEGSDQADIVYVREFQGDVLVRFGVRGNGNLQGELFSADEVDSVFFRGNAGDDVFVNRTDLNSRAHGDDGNDLFRGGSGDDSFHGGAGDDNFRGNDGNDDLHGDTGNDWIDGGAGNDELYGWLGNDTLRGGDGDDYVSGYLGNDWAHGGDGDDDIRGHEGNDRLFGGNGDDEIRGWLGDDVIVGGGGDDYLSGYLGNDRISGNGGDDDIRGHEGNDQLFGGDGNDQIFGWEGWDLVVGGEGNDELWGGNGRDTLVGNGGNDILHGDNGGDWLNGGDGNDILAGWFGNDRLIGGAGADILCGGFNDDTYVEIDAEDIGYDIDSAFISEGISRADQTLEAGAGEAFNDFLESILASSELSADAGRGAWLPSINFETDAFGNALQSGDVISEQFAAWGIQVSSLNGQNPAMIFDTANPTGGDDDLATDNQSLVLILSEDGDSTDPDDNARGGTFVFDFDRAVMLDQLGFLDLEGEGAATISLFDSAGNLISETVVDGAGDNLQQSVDLNADEVSQLTITLRSSGALTDIVFCNEGHA